MHSKDVNSNVHQYRTSRSWIDDLPPCENSGIAFSVNKIFREDASPIEEHSFEDRSFHCRPDDGTYLYGIFDGHMGTRAADFGLQRMAAEILLGQLIEKKNDDEVKDVLRQAYMSVERGYLDSIDDLLAERASVQCEIPDGLNAYDAYQKYPHLFEKLKSINYKLSSGTSALMSLIHNNRLFVANLGNSRALLCRTDTNAVLRVIQLSVDHDLRNEDELLRLLQLGISTENLKYGQHIGNQETTRCLGNYLVKAGYREHEELQSALGEPVIADPDIHGGINIDESCRFLVLMSAGLYKSLEEVIPANDVNKYIAQLIVEQFRLQTSVNDVAQAVLDKTVQLHQDRILKSNDCSTLRKLEDMTLIIRNFNFPMLNISHPSSTNSSDMSTSTFNSTIMNTTNTNSTNSSLDEINNGIVDNNRRLKPYVDFSDYYNNIRRQHN